MSFDSILPTVDLLSNWSQSIQTVLALYQLSLCHILILFVISTIFIVPSSGVDSLSRSHFLCSLLRTNFSSIQVLSWDCSNSATSSGSISNSSSLAISINSAVTFSMEVLIPLKLIHGGLESTSKLLLILILNGI